MNFAINTHKQTFKKLIPFFIICICSIPLFIRCFFSFSWTDESYYLTVVHRFWIGERMFADEWYITQLSAPLLLPFYAFYHWLTGGNDGVYLYFRLIYCVISTLTALFTYSKLKRWNSSFAALSCSLIYLFYSRANIGGLSYYNMTLTLVLFGILLIYEQLMNNHGDSIKLLFCGILLALAVVVTPFLAIPYIIIAIVLLLYPGKHPIRKEVFTVIIGTGLTAIVYLMYVFNNVTLDEIILNIPHILNGPGLQKNNLLLALPIVILRIVWRYKWTFFPYVLLYIYICYKYYKKQTFTSKDFKWIMGINLAIFIVNFYLSSNLLGCINIALLLFGLIIVIYYSKWNVENKNIILCFFISGFSVVFGFTFSSNTGLDAMSIGFVILAIGTILFLFQNEDIPQNEFVYNMIRIVVISTIIQTAFLRILSVYRDAPLNELNTQITSGPAKYLYTTEEHVEQYYNLKNDIATYVRENDIVFYSQICFWGNLCTENEYGMPSSWRMRIDNPQLEEYYTLNPEKIPTCLFILKPEYGNFESSLIQNNEKTDRPNENALEGFLYDYIIENEYEMIETESSMIFRKRY